MAFALCDTNLRKTMILKCNEFGEVHTHLAVGGDGGEKSIGHEHRAAVFVDISVFKGV